MCVCSPATLRHPLISTADRVQDASAAVGVSRLTGSLLRACVFFAEVAYNNSLPLPVEGVGTRIVRIAEHVVENV